MRMVCVHGRSCQGLIECLYMTSSCWGLGCMLGKVENNEQKTAAKHNRIHLYLPAAVWPCMWTALACDCHALRTLNTKHTKCRGKEQVWSQLYKEEHRPVCLCLRSPNHKRGYIDAKCFSRADAPDFTDSKMSPVCHWLARKQNLDFRAVLVHVNSWDAKPICKSTWLKRLEV